MRFWCPCFGQLNDSSEAMDRIHRLGQRRPVEAIKLVVEEWEDIGYRVEIQ